MKPKIIKWIQEHYHRTVNSIAFLPAIIATVFLILAIVMLYIDFSEFGKSFKSNYELIRLKDASTARTIISVIAAGIISLTVFSFSMVMVVLNQAASQMSNRVLDKLIGNRFQQAVLGYYIGTIVYALFLLSAIRDIDSGIYVPALSTYLLILFTVIAIFLFVYFLHHITQSVKYVIIIDRIFKQTKKALKKTCRLQAEPELEELQEGEPVGAEKSGVFENFNKDDLTTLAREKELQIAFLYPKGTHVIEGTPVVKVKGELDEEARSRIQLSIYINNSETIESNFYFGFRQLMEVAVKALSPGINDPGTAVESLRALADLFSFRLKHYPDNVVRDQDNQVRLITVERSFEDLFYSSLLPIWDYGKNDRLIQKEMLHVLQQLMQQKQHPAISKLYATVVKHASENHI